MNKVSISSIKPKLSFWQIWNMSFGFLGIQFGFALQNANVSRIFETLGASQDELPILWLAAPVTGLAVQPIIGYYSDRTWFQMGKTTSIFRRRRNTGLDCPFYNAQLLRVVDGGDYALDS